MVSASIVQPNIGAACLSDSSCAITQADVIRSVNGPGLCPVSKPTVLALTGFMCRPAMPKLWPAACWAICISAVRLRQILELSTVGSWSGTASPAVAAAWSRLLLVAACVGPTPRFSSSESRAIRMTRPSPSRVRRSSARNVPRWSRARVATAEPRRTGGPRSAAGRPGSRRHPGRTD